MKRCYEDGYNKDPIHPDEKMVVSLTIDKLIEELQTAKEVLGGNCIVMSAGDCGSNYAEIRSIHGENFHDNLILVLSEDWSPDEKIKIYSSIPEIE